MPVQQAIMHPMERDMHRLPFVGQPDLRIFEMNKRLQQWSQEVDNLWWDTFATEFFDDEAILTLTLYLDNALKKYTIGRTLIPRFFRSLFEGGVVELYFMLRQSKEVYNHSSVVLDCEHASMVTHHIRPFFTKVLTEGRLLLEMGVDELMRIRVWHFSIHHHYELIPRSIIAMQDSSISEHLSINITRKGLTNHTLNFLRLCVILEPMQELMSRYKVYGLTPRDCLKTTLFQKWQKLISPPDSHKIPSKRKKKKSSLPISTTPNNPTTTTSLSNSPNNKTNNNISNNEFSNKGTDGSNNGFINVNDSYKDLPTSEQQ